MDSIRLFAKVRRTVECCLPHFGNTSALNDCFVSTCHIRILFLFRCKPGFRNRVLWILNNTMALWNCCGIWWRQHVNRTMDWLPSNRGMCVNVNKMHICRSYNRINGTDTADVLRVKQVVSLKAVFNKKDSQIRIRFKTRMRNVWGQSEVYLRDIWDIFWENIKSTTNFDRKFWKSFAEIWGKYRIIP